MEIAIARCLPHKDIDDQQKNNDKDEVLSILFGYALNLFLLLRKNCRRSAILKDEGSEKDVTYDGNSYDANAISPRDDIGAKKRKSSTRSSTVKSQSAAKLTPRKKGSRSNDVSKKRLDKEGAKKKSNQSPVFYVVDKILGKRAKDGSTEYRVKWKGYKTTSWEPEKNLVCYCYFMHLLFT